MSCYINESSHEPGVAPPDHGKRRSPLLAYAAFVGAVLFTLAAASALVTSDLPLPLFE